MTKVSQSMGIWTSKFKSQEKTMKQIRKSGYKL